MSEVKFTKGPWISMDGDCMDGDWCTTEMIVTTQERINNSKSEICGIDIYFDGQHGIEQSANLHLIRTAPVMYEEIERDIVYLDQMKTKFVLGSYEYRSICTNIESKQKLLVKARGE